MPDGTLFITPSLDPFEITKRRPALFMFRDDKLSTLDVFGRWG
jgi:hypothetical protein